MGAVTDDDMVTVRLSREDAKLWAESFWHRGAFERLVEAARAALAEPQPDPPVEVPEPPVLCTCGHPEAWHNQRKREPYACDYVSCDCREYRPAPPAETDGERDDADEPTYEVTWQGRSDRPPNKGRYTEASLRRELAIEDDDPGCHYPDFIRAARAVLAGIDAEPPMPGAAE